MRKPLRLWQLVLLMLAGCGLVLGVLYHRQSRSITNLGQLLARLPSDRAVVAALDVKSLRTAGVLDLIAGARSVEELDYQNFVRETGFDYREDLDYVAAAFDSEHKYFLLKGRFNWTQLNRYAKAKGGTCVNGFCSVRGSMPTKNISFFPASTDVLALAVGYAPRAAYTMMPSDRPENGIEIPSAPFWVTLPGPLLSANETLPDGVKAFASALAGAERVTVAVDAGATGFSANLRAECPGAKQAEEVRDRLRSLTEVLTKMIQRSGQKPNPEDLSGVLTSGQFEAQGAAVTGKWPIPRALLEAVSAGTL
ncbi:MAG: hypothetical protein J0L64_18270 [Acidobacteria bacterium]|nr:hypothetical protein [Acidobacteriota bacterium]